ncbi:uncharacterized protein [Antedon mediterranea]|uniref:uncharacterized protein n=1 Tax=Antedon mediterranea TaxID=105859 RepID=UPI003AF5CC21
MKDLGEISYFLGIDFKQEADKITMNQTRYTLKVLEKFNMSNCKTRSTPCEVQTGICPNNEKVQLDRYRQIVGSLIYLATCTRPDIIWVVSKLSRSLADPKLEDLTTAKHVLRYLKGTVNHKLVYRKSDSMKLTSYCDSDWASSDDRKSTTGYIFSLNECSAPIYWKTRRPPTVALSTCESEYMGLGAATQEALYLLQLLNDICPNEFKCAHISCDNQGAMH